MEVEVECCCGCGFGAAARVTCDAAMMNAGGSGFVIYSRRRGERVHKDGVETLVR